MKKPKKKFLKKIDFFPKQKISLTYSKHQHKSNMSSSMPIVTENVAIVSDPVVTNPVVTNPVVTKAVTKSLPLKYKTAMYAVLGFIKNLADNGDVDPSVFPLAVAKLPLFLEVSEQMKSLDEMFDLKHIEKTIVKPLVAMEKKKNAPPTEKKARVPKEKKEKAEKVPKEKKEKVPKEKKEKVPKEKKEKAEKVPKDKKEKVEKKKKGKEETSDNEVEVVIANNLPEWPEEQKAVEEVQKEVEEEQKEVEEVQKEVEEVQKEVEEVQKEVEVEEVQKEVEEVEQQKVEEVEEEASASESEKKKKDPKKKKNPEDKEKRGRKPKEIQMESVFMEKEEEKVELNTESYVQVTAGDGKKIKVAKRKV